MSAHEPPISPSQAEVPTPVVVKDAALQDIPANQGMHALIAEQIGLNDR